MYVCVCVYTVVFGAPSGGSADLQLSLDAALCAAAALHTAWPPLAHPPQDTDSYAESDVSHTGVTARLLYLTHDYSVLEIPAAALQVRYNTLTHAYL